MHAFGLNIKMVTDCLMVLKNLELTVNAHAINSPIKGLHRQSSSTMYTINATVHMDSVYIYYISAIVPNLSGSESKLTYSF